jgi:hypothetical protein
MLLDAVVAFRCPYPGPRVGDLSAVMLFSCGVAGGFPVVQVDGSSPRFQLVPTLPSETRWSISRIFF